MRGCRADWRPFAAVGSQLGMPVRSARNRSSSSSGARACMVTVSVLTSASPERIGIALIGIRMLRPSRTGSSTCAARSVPVFPGFSRITSHPLLRRGAGALRCATAERTPACAVRRSPAWAGRFPWAPHTALRAGANFTPPLPVDGHARTGPERAVPGTGEAVSATKMH